MWRFIMARHCHLSRQDGMGLAGTGDRSPNGMLQIPSIVTSKTLFSLPQLGTLDLELAWSGGRQVLSRPPLENCPPSPSTSVQGCKLTLVFPNGLLGLFLMCTYKEFTVGKGLGLPRSAVWVFFLLLCAYLSIWSKEMFMTYTVCLLVEAISHIFFVSCSKWSLLWTLFLID